VCSGASKRFRVPFHEAASIGSSEGRPGATPPAIRHERAVCRHNQNEMHRGATVLIVLALAAAACVGGGADDAERRPDPHPSLTNHTERGLVSRPGSSLTAIDGIRASDIWAVGEVHGTNAHWRSLVAHWDGGSWRLVPVPDAGRLSALSVTGADDGWALGDKGLLHWDGAGWSMVALPRGSYVSMSASGPNDVWVAGTRPGPMVGHNSRGVSSLVAH
jgi:hypothetical protein